MASKAKSSKPVQVAHKVKERSTLLPDDKGLEIYKVTNDELYLPGKMHRKIMVGVPDATVRAPDKVLMLVGATGAGKSTLINSMINYIFGVEWDDDFRFKLIDEVTTKITAYSIYCMDGAKINYNLTVIDIPGFGDISGPKRDREIAQQIKKYFSEISHLDGIAFVVPASIARLSPTQQYVFDSCLSMFGKDIAINIVVMVTFADGQTPPVLSAIESAGITHSGCFKFNNSALFARRGSEEVEDDGVYELFWKMGATSFKNFFFAFEKMRRVSLTMSKKVLQQHEHFNIISTDISNQMNACLSTVQNVQPIRDILERCASGLEIDPAIFEPIFGSYYYPTECYSSNHRGKICHQHCIVKNKTNCMVMHFKHNTKICSVCGCTPSIHGIEESSVAVTLKATEKIQPSVEITAIAKEKLAVHYLNLQESNSMMEKMAREAQKCQAILHNKGLKTNPLMQVEYIDRLIESEKREAKEGWQECVKYLEIRKEQVELLAIIKYANNPSKQITIEQRRRESGWENRVDLLEKFKQIKAELDNPTTTN